MHDRPTLKGKDPVCQRQHQIEIVFDDDDRQLRTQSVEHLEQLDHDRGREAFKRLVKQQQVDVAG